MSPAKAPSYRFGEHGFAFGPDPLGVRAAVFEGAHAEARAASALATGPAAALTLCAVAALETHRFWSAVTASYWRTCAGLTTDLAEPSVAETAGQGDGGAADSPAARVTVASLTKAGAT